MANPKAGESEIRAAVEADVVRRAAGETRVIHELGLFQSQARIDIASVNGRLVGWEIKSAADTLVRLPSQASIYSRVFEQVWLVADEKHLEAAEEMVPEWWGIMRADLTNRGVRLERERGARLNPDIDEAAVVRLLWRSEALAELERLGLADGLHRAPRRELWAALAAAVPSKISSAGLRRRVREVLKDREGWRSG